MGGNSAGKLKKGRVERYALLLDSGAVVRRRRRRRIDSSVGRISENRCERERDEQPRMANKTSLSCPVAHRCAAFVRPVYRAR